MIFPHIFIDAFSEKKCVCVRPCKKEHIKFINNAWFQIESRKNKKKLKIMAEISKLKLLIMLEFIAYM